MKINEDLLPVIISSVEPTGVNRKKIWKRHSYNLCNPDLLYIFNSGNYIGTKNYSTIGSVPVKPSTTYKFYIYKPCADNAVYEYDKDGNRIKTTPSNPFTTSSNCAYIGFYFQQQSGGTATIENTPIMLVEQSNNSIILPYEPYVEDEDFILNDLGNYESMSNWIVEPTYSDKVLKNGYIDSSAIHHQGNGVTDILSFLKDFSTLLSCFTNAKWVGTGGAADVDTDIPVNKSSGGGLVLAFHTWHSSAGANTRIQIDAIRLGYSGDNVKVNNILTEGAGSGSVGYSINDSKNLHYKLTGTNGMIKSKLICLG